MNLFNTGVLGYLLFMKVPPQFAVLPGTAGMNMADYAPPALHAANFLKGCGFGAVAALAVASITHVPAGVPDRGTARPARLDVVLASQRPPGPRAGSQWY